jgi:hypothetical protein
MGTLMVSTLAGLKPGSVPRSAHRLRIMSPAPTKSTRDSATSETTSALRVRWPAE